MGSASHRNRSDCCLSADPPPWNQSPDAVSKARPWVETIGQACTSSSAPRRDVRRSSLKTCGLAQGPTETGRYFGAYWTGISRLLTPMPMQLAGQAAGMSRLFREQAETEVCGLTGWWLDTVSSEPVSGAEYPGNSDFAGYSANMRLFSPRGWERCCLKSAGSESC